MVFRIFTFIIILYRTSGKKEQLDENHIRHGYGNYFENAILKAT